MTPEERDNIIRETLEAVKAAVRDRMVKQEWPPQDGDMQIEDCLAAIDALMPKPVEVDPLVEAIEKWLHSHLPPIESALRDALFDRVLTALRAAGLASSVAGYEIGRWYDWDGSTECPLPPETPCERMYASGSISRAPAKLGIWGKIIRFRVTAATGEE